MKKTLKSFLLLTLSMVTVLSIFAGCQDKKSDSSNSYKTSDIYDSSKPYTGKFVNGKLTKPFHIKMPTPQSFTEGIVADKKGFFKEVGIIPEYTGVLQPNASLAQSVIKGQNDLFGAGHITTIASARQAGAKLKIVLTGSVDSPELDKSHMVWFAKDGSSIKSAADLNGKIIAMSSKGSCAELWNAEFLRQNNVDASKTKIVVMPDQQQEQALKQGNIDVAIIHAPYSKKARNDGGFKVLTSSYKIAEGAGDGRLSGVGVRAFSEDFIKKYPDVVKAYIVADYKAQQYVNAHYEDALKVSAKSLGVDVKDVSGNLYANQKWVIPQQINFWIKVAEKNRLSGFEIHGKVKASDLYTNEYNPYYKNEIK